MEQSPSWEANWFRASQEIPRVLWNPKVHHRTHTRPPPVPILRQPNSVHTPTSHSLKIHPNIIPPSTPGSSQRSLSLRFPHQNPVDTSPLPHTRHMPRPSHINMCITETNVYRRTVVWMCVDRALWIFGKNLSCFKFLPPFLLNTNQYNVYRMFESIFDLLTVAVRSNSKELVTWTIWTPRKLFRIPPGMYMCARQN
jgi:hypothetical protein